MANIVDFVVVDFLNIPPPSCPTPNITAAEMRGPPPLWNPPSPPLPGIDSLQQPSTIVEESQYEEPQMPVTGLQPDGDER
uniref:Uncharacterized protein n=1 Tax=Syphacia muris TaxID=451379 RepID=A0A0N5AA35_9BILA